MGKISVVLAAILCAAAPLAPIGAVGMETEQAFPSDRLGKELVSLTRSSYEKGIYKEFLSRMDVAYKEADLSGLIQMREKNVPVDFQQEWEQQFLALQKAKNQELLAALSDKDDSLLAQKIRSAAANVSSPEQEKAVSKLNSFIAKAPKTGANDDENALIDIDLEYEYKMLHAQLPYSDISPLLQQEHQLALRMEKMEKMVQASKSFQDHALKQVVGLAAANLDVRLAHNLDGVDLNAFAKRKPTTELEKKIHSILSSYRSQFSDLMQQIDSANR